ncbi:YceI family protein [Pedobacter sp. MR2016-24]|uniref:YceI family protein n=1 Tax=Pedobacter sp. MR2016-24 TaxID=2994466 RepID=UPI002247EDB9|nr:YceI family protein [Pedobacter sp. MR2016-24]MCX2484461.1 YceI family protein [Pedobacter sp. MR2016-24]
MSLSSKISKGTVLILLAQMFAIAAIAQVKYSAKDNLKILVSGTSTLHDWTMATAKGDCSATFTVNGAGQLTDLTAMHLSIPVESLKSEKTAMDKNAYKALKASKFSAITYTLSSATVTADGKVKCQGSLSVAGTAVPTELLATAKVNADKSISISGSKKISMKAYKVDPPTFMMGTIKTGNDITVNFDLVLRK